MFRCVCFENLQCDKSLKPEGSEGVSFLGEDEIETAVGECLHLVLCKPNCGKLAKCPFPNDLIPLVKDVLKMNWVIASSTILLDGLDHIVDSFKAAHFFIFYLFLFYSKASEWAVAPDDFIRREKGRRQGSVGRVGGTCLFSPVRAGSYSGAYP